MKREGRQHGSVRSYPILPAPYNPKPESRYINRLDSPPTAGLFTRVPSKPTNHSKFTGKCGRPRCDSCRLHPGTKSKDKSKGTQKLRRGDTALNYRLVTWRVVDAKPGLNLAGFSASGMLDHLSKFDYLNDEEDDRDDEDDDHRDCVDEVHEESTIVEIGISSGAVESAVINDDEDDDENVEMSFCDVGAVWDQIDEDEGWCLVEEM